MPIALDSLLSTTEAQVLHAVAQALPFQDGALTAGPVARAVKANEQAASGPATQAVLDKVQNALSAHPLFAALACPRVFVRLMVTRTRDGGHYGTHVDNALIAGARADLSFTLFLSDPQSYDGGELVIADRLEDRAVKLPQGAAVLYPSNTLHRVAPVTRGERLVVVGWVQSWVADPAQREILFDLWRVIDATADPEQAQLLSKTRSNLLRMWAR